jgi:hypothetical protein
MVPGGEAGIAALSGCREVGVLPRMRGYRAGARRSGAVSVR